MEYKTGYYYMLTLTFITLAIASFSVWDNYNLNKQVNRLPQSIESTYIWNDENKTIDAEFIVMCQDFISDRFYIDDVYNCVNFSQDFMTLANIAFL